MGNFNNSITLEKGSLFEQNETQSNTLLYEQEQQRNNIAQNLLLFIFLLPLFVSTGSISIDKAYKKEEVDARIILTLDKSSHVDDEEDYSFISGKGYSEDDILYRDWNELSEQST